MLKMQFVDALRDGTQPLFVAAPLAGISHRAFRVLLELYGSADYYVNEMISCDALNANSAYESWYLDTLPVPHKTVIQLLGSNPESILAAGERIASISCAGLDLNMGCSAPAILRRGAGARWMQKTDVMYALISSLREKISPMGLSVKLRLPAEDPEKDTAAMDRFIGFCCLLEKSGVQAITFHARLQNDPWARPARQRLFPILAQELRIPVLVNGDIASLQQVDSIKKSYESRGIPFPPGYMVGRALLSQPWLFSSLRGIRGQINRQEMAHMFHELLERHQPRDFWDSRARRFHAYAWKQLRFGSRLSAQIQSVAQYSQILDIVDSYFLENPDEVTVRY